jgi:hypothetical protein
MSWKTSTSSSENYGFYACHLWCPDAMKSPMNVMGVLWALNGMTSYKNNDLI